jgi:TP901 family phage tail tape measure protein
VASGTEIGKGYVGVTAETKGLQSQLTSLGSTLGGKMGPVGAKLGNALGGSMGNALTEQLGPASGPVEKLSGMLSKAGPWGIAGAAAVSTAAAVGTALYKLGGDFGTQYRAIARGTGATGKDMESLKQTFKDVASNSAGSFSQVSEAIIGVQRYTGPLSKQLEGISGQFITLSRITGTDVKTNVEAGTKALEQWNIPQKEAPKALNELFTASQKTGVGFSDLASNVTRFAPQLRTMGYSFVDSTAMLAQFDKQGVNTPKIMAAMNLAANKLGKEQTGANEAVVKAGESVTKYEAALKKAKPGTAAYADAQKHLTDAQAAQKTAVADQAKVQGQTLPAALAKSIDAIKGAKTDTEAMTLASETFGSRGAPSMMQAIRNGSLDFKELSKQVQGSGDSIHDTAERTKTLSGSFAKLRNKAKVAMEPLATGVFKGVNTGLIATMTGLSKAIDWMMVWFPKIAKVVSTVLAPSFAFVGQIITDMWHIAAPVFNIWKDAIGLVIDLLTGNWQGAWNRAKALVGDVMDYFKSIGKLLFDYVTWPFQILPGKVGESIRSFLDKVREIPTKVLDSLSTLGANVFNAILNGFSTAYDAVTGALVSFWNTVTALPGDVVSGLANLGTMVWNAISGGFGTAVGAAESALGSFWGLVTGLPGRVISGWANLGTMIWNALSSGFSKAKEGAESGLGSLWTTLSGLPERIKKGIGDLGGTLLQKGKDLVNGFVKGITSLPNAIGNALTGLIPGPLKKFAGALGLASPSKVFEQFGRDTLQGYINGINQMSPHVDAALTSAVPDIGTATGGTTAAGAGAASPAVHIQDAHFYSELDVEAFMKKAAWVVQTKRI